MAGNSRISISFSESYIEEETSSRLLSIIDTRTSSNVDTRLYKHMSFVAGHGEACRENHPSWQNVRGFFERIMDDLDVESNVDNDSIIVYSPRRSGKSTAIASFIRTMNSLSLYGSIFCPLLIFKNRAMKEYFINNHFINERDSLPFVGVCKEEFKRDPIPPSVRGKILHMIIIEDVIMREYHLGNVHEYIKVNSRIPRCPILNILTPQ